MGQQQIEKLAGLRSDDEWLLIIFDALRYDTFDHFMGEAEVQLTVSPAVATHAWMKTVWPDTYDVCYVTASPLVGEHNLSTYNGAEHFDSMVEVWKDTWDKEVRTCRPEPVTDAAMEALTEHDKVLVHYVQPHAPYIGETELIGRADTGGGPAPHPRDAEDNTGVLEVIRDQLKSGGITLETLRRAYYDNLIHVIERSRPIIETADRRTVVTSDHGECLGEHTVGHNFDCAHVRNVPWFEV